ncbi:19518_t:CDS:2 [Racocetra fulgida]|uniref:19518_t:CDS:1 n=1 Tax=Racocetra fulgida TaxID=60492 RepID=A0A9N9G0W9_9GLOM|nr:19518_t:CDS:2 [Racocetra fulgida]
MSTPLPTYLINFYDQQFAEECSNQSTLNIFSFNKMTYNDDLKKDFREKSIIGNSSKIYTNEPDYIKEVERPLKNIQLILPRKEHYSRPKEHCSRELNETSIKKLTYKPLEIPEVHNLWM